MKKNNEAPSARLSLIVSPLVRPIDRLANSLLPLNAKTNLNAGMGFYLSSRPKPSLFMCLMTGRKPFAGVQVSSKTKSQISTGSIIIRDILAAAMAAPFAIGIPFPANNLVVHYSSTSEPFAGGLLKIKQSPLESLRSLYGRVSANMLGGMVSKVGFLAPYFIINDLAKGSQYEKSAYCASLAASGFLQSLVTYHVRCDQLVDRLCNQGSGTFKPSQAHFSQADTVKRYLHYSSFRRFIRVYPYWLGCYMVANPATIAALDFGRRHLRAYFPDWSHERVTLTAAVLCLTPLQIPLIISNTWAIRNMVQKLLGKNFSMPVKGPISYILLFTIIQKVGESALGFTLGERFKHSLTFFWQTPTSDLPLDASVKKESIHFSFSNQRFFFQLSAAAAKQSVLETKDPDSKKTGDKHPVVLRENGGPRF